MTTKWKFATLFLCATMSILLSLPALSANYRLSFSANAQNPMPWADGVVLYRFSSDPSSSFTAAEKRSIEAGMDLWRHPKTWLVFEELSGTATSSDPGHILFVKSIRCFTPSYGQPPTGSTVRMELTTGCALDNSVPAHEIGHAIGLYHEHQRKDRAPLININEANIDNSLFPFCSPSVPFSCGDSQFNRTTQTANPTGPFDFDSIMMYANNIFALPGTNIITPVDPTIPLTFGNPSDISQGDIEVIDILYLRKLHRIYGTGSQTCLKSEISAPSYVRNENDSDLVDMVSCEPGNLEQSWYFSSGGYIINYNGLCLAVNASSNEVEARYCQNADNFKWVEIWPPGRGNIFKTLHTNMCLSKVNGLGGTPVVASCNGSQSQKWSSSRSKNYFFPSSLR